MKIFDNRDDDIEQAVKKAKTACCVGYVVVMMSMSFMFLLIGAANYVADEKRDRNNRIDWPECFNLRGDETFEQCQESILHRYEAEMIAGGLMFTFLCVAMLTAGIVKCTQQLFLNRQRVRLIENVEEQQNKSYGSTQL